MRLLIFSATQCLALLAACASVDVYLVKSSGVTNMLGAQYRVCKSKIRFQGTSFSVEGLVGPTKSATETKSFQVAKLGVTQNQAVSISSVALALDSLQEQMCETTRDFALRSDASYERYTSERDARLERIVGALAAAESSLKKGESQDKVTTQLAEAISPK